MTVSELIVHLEEIKKEHGPEVRVFTDGYEGGYEDVGGLLVVDEFLLKVNKEWYYGPHKRLNDDTVDATANYEVVKGIVL